MTEITITLNKIAAQCPRPCSDGWDAILLRTDMHGNDYDREWPLAAVLDTDRPGDALWALRCLPAHNNLWRRYAVWCARQVQHLMTGPRGINALDVAERHAHGLATDEELAAASEAASAASEAACAAAWAASAAAWAAASAAACAASEAASAAARSAAWAASEAASAAAWAADRAAARAAAWAAQYAKLRQILTAGEWVE